MKLWKLFHVFHLGNEDICKGERGSKYSIQVNQNLTIAKFRVELFYQVAEAAGTRLKQKP